MTEHGIAPERVLALLRSSLGQDISFDSGKILGSMCTRPHSIAQEVFTRYIEKNIGDPGLCASTEKLETDAIRMMSSLVSLKKGAGHIVTGGTEANILALWTARNSARKKVSSFPEVILPSSAHFSFDKAADMLGLKLVKIDLNDKHQIDIGKVKKAINAKTIALVGVAGSTSLGVVDSIEELSDIAVKKGLYLHVDAAIGGYVLPFIGKLGHDSPGFDFRLAGVSSMTIDPHKMGMSVIPSGGLIYRTKELAETIKVGVPYLSGGESARATIVGTRSGASVLATWALLKHLGYNGYKSIVRRCMDLTLSLRDKVKAIDGLDVVMDPTINIVGIRVTRGALPPIVSHLRKLGWAISQFPDHIRIVCMPHVYEAHIDHFLDDLKGLLRTSK
jgi:tyrosine decarboxylase / aspartate 1-decarboxylase